jgi:hypothetical protein
MWSTSPGKAYARLHAYTLLACPWIDRMGLAILLFAAPAALAGRRVEQSKASAVGWPSKGEPGRWTWTEIKHNLQAPVQDERHAAGGP